MAACVKHKYDHSIARKRLLVVDNGKITKLGKRTEFALEKGVPFNS